MAKIPAPRPLFHTGFLICLPDKKVHIFGSGGNKRGGAENLFNLESIEIPDSVTEIGSDAFRD